MVNFEALAFPHTFELEGSKYKGKRIVKEGKIIIPCLECPEISMKSMIIQIQKPNNIEFETIDFEFNEGSTLGTVSDKPNILTIYIENKLEKSKTVPQSNFNIGTINSTAVQVGNLNNQNIDLNIQQLVQQVVESEDEEAKGILKELLENSTVASLIGVGVANLISLL